MKPVIKFTVTGQWNKTESWLKSLKHANFTSILNKYGQAGVEALREATPVDSGKTAQSWFYEIEQTSNSINIYWKNSNINDGVPVAVLIQYGHNSKNGVWIKGLDYINPALRPIFEEITKQIEKEVSH